MTATHRPDTRPPESGTPTLSARLREETREEHRRAERTDFARHLVGGDASIDDFLLLFDALRPVYRALEDALDRHGDHPAVSPVRFTELYRSAALEDDLELLASLTDAAAERGRDASAAYVARIETVAASDPARLPAHAYVRYMGDLSGGQLIGHRLREAIGSARAPAGSSVSSGSDRTGPPPPAFAVFDVTGGVNAAKARFRESLDALAASGRVAVEAIVEEAKDAFDFNRSLFEGLGRLGSTPGRS